ncbi:hypothetical protein ACWC0A_26690 [Streptomyces scopuliridis]
MVTVGAGGAMAVTALTALLLENVPAERAGAAAGVLIAAATVAAGAVATALLKPARPASVRTLP